MQKDPILRVRLESAQNRRDRFLATEVEKGDERRRVPAETSTPAPRSTDPAPTRVSAADVPIPEEEDEDIPEVTEEDVERGSEPPEKRERTSSHEGESAVGDQEHRSAEVESIVSGDGEPESKRPRTGTLNQLVVPSPKIPLNKMETLCVAAGEIPLNKMETRCAQSEIPLNKMETRCAQRTLKNVSWADIEEEGPSGAAIFSLRCDHCDKEFSSRNALFAHLRSVRKDEPDHEPPNDPSRSVADGLAHTDEIARGGLKNEEPRGAPKVETSKRSRYDVCEVFSPARLTRRTGRHKLRGGLGSRLVPTVPSNWKSVGLPDQRGSGMGQTYGAEGQAGEANDMPSLHIVQQASTSL